MSSIEENVDALLDESLLAKVTSSNNQSRLQAHEQLFAILQVCARVEQNCKAKEAMNASIPHDSTIVGSICMPS